MQEICRRLKLMREQSGLSVKEVSDRSGVPFPTLKKLFAGQTENPSFQTIRDVTLAMGGLLDALVSEHFDEQDGKANAKADAAAVIEAKDQIIKLYQKSVASKNAWLLRLFVVACCLFALLAGLTIYDFANPHAGLFLR